VFRFVETFHHFFAFCLSVFWILLVKHQSNISQPFFQISEANIISRGISNGHEYIVYCSDKGVNVNTDFKKIGKDMYNCCSYYDRKLCDTISKFEEMSKEKIESQAYGSWMDGAHS
jgi:hypothetical protein